MLSFLFSPEVVSLLPPRDHCPIPEPAKALCSILSKNYLVKLKYLLALLEEGVELSEEGED